MVTSCKANDILGTLFWLIRHYKMDYCWPSQEKLLYLLARWHRCRISIATLNRWLRAIEDDGYIFRTRRIKRHPKRGMLFKSTMYKISKKGFAKLAMLGVSVKGWVNGESDNNNNHKPDPRNGSGEDVRMGKMAPLKNHIAEVLKCPVIAGQLVSAK
ncbi:hypothetical protein ES703_28999 [subsurface metagenome]